VDDGLRITKTRTADLTRDLLSLDTAFRAHVTQQRANDKEVDDVLLERNKDMVEWMNTRFVDIKREIEKVAADQKNRHDRGAEFVERVREVLEQANGEGSV
jgi:hypothetical protein